MTIPEATQLVMQAGAMGGNGEVFLLDMGEPVKIIELAQRMVELSGLKVKDANNHGDIEIKITGLRPGEKLYEELLIGDTPISTDHPEIYMGLENFIQKDQLLGLISTLVKHCENNEALDASQYIHTLINNTKVTNISLQTQALVQHQI
jgi:FlaA1/EpsC-like NDP-sugar epimerase